MATKKTPGVYIEEISIFPPSIAAVETAIPVFIGFTEEAKDEKGNSLTNKPKRLTSLMEYEKFFGKAQTKDFSVAVAQQGTNVKVTFETAPGLPSHYLYYSMQLFYANGGGPCYVISVGDYDDPATAKLFTDFFNTGDKLLEAYDEPTLLLFPDACLLATDDEFKVVVDASLSHCKKMQDRFAIIDVRDAHSGGGTKDNAQVTANFRGKVASDLDLVKYGAAYFPYLLTALPFRNDDKHIKIHSHTTDVGTAIAADTTLADVKTSHTAVYNAVMQFVATATVTIPASGGVAGVYARVDGSRGVWKAPANVSILNVIEPALMITDELNDGLNIDATSGKSVNAIRAFAGKGTLVWGARTLAGNDNENRYVPVRRFLIFAEESIKKATAFFVFEPNDANTWTKVRSMIESFLIRQWRDGALAGAKSDDAFYVSVGLNKTMSAQDILDGYMIVEIGLAIVRPAEFIILRFAQKMQQS
jgi:phage tail sheath protein FI